MTISLDQARAAKEKIMILFAALPGFSGAGVGKAGDDYCVAVRFTAPPMGNLPTEIDGVKVMQQVVGEVVALETE